MKLILVGILLVSLINDIHACSNFVVNGVKNIICSNVDSPDKINYLYVNSRYYNQYLVITNSTITHLTPMAFERFSTIKRLYLNNIHLKTVSSGAFNGLTELEELHLNGNELEELSNGVYNSLHKLQVLNLTSNKIKKIDKSALVGVVSLQQLLLKDNNLTRIEDGFLQLQNQLTHLDLAENNINNFTLNTNLTLKFLNLSSNKIAEVDFSHFPRSQIVDLSHNDIVLVRNCDLQMSTQINFEGNKIRQFECRFHNLLKFSLRSNQLQSVESTLFRNSPKLSEIDLSYNHISKLDSSVFKSLTMLKYLNLSHNHLEGFQYGTFDKLTSLLTLDISHNKLIDLGQYNFYSLSSLENLLFNHNGISDLNANDLDAHLPKLLIISLDHNAWNCKKLVYIIKVLSSHLTHVREGESYDTDNVRGIKCSSNDKNVSSLFLEDFAKNLTNIFQQALTRWDNQTKIGFKSDTVSTSPQLVSQSSNSTILVFGVIFQIITALLLLGVIFPMYNVIKKIQNNYRPIHSLPELELH